VYPIKYEGKGTLFPQGSVLGPLLPLVFINNLPKFVSDKSVPILYADGTTLL